MRRMIDDHKIPVHASDRLSYRMDKQDERKSHFSLMGTMIYFFLKRSTLAVHFRTLLYPSSGL